MLKENITLLLYYERLGIEKIAETGREIIALPNSGIQAGSFRVFEQISTPEFVDFVITNIGGLLISKGSFAV